MKSLIFFFFLLLSPLMSLGQFMDDTWVETEAEITEVRTKTNRKATRSYGQVTFKANDGQIYQGEVELAAIPFIGTMKSVGDKVTVFYDPKQPIYVKSQSSSFIEKYGMYILIALGIIFSFWNISKTLSKNRQSA